MMPEIFEQRNRPLTAFEAARLNFGMDDIESLRPSPRPWRHDEIADLVGLGGIEVQRLEKGLLGYRSQYICGPAKILADGNADMGVHTILSADALDVCRKPAPAIVKTIRAGLGRFSRVDLAIDDFDGALNLPEMIGYCERCQCVTRAREFAVVKSQETATGNLTGLTLYIGSRESDHYFRVYDKRLESIKKGADPEKLPGHWIRCEAELKGPAAVNISGLIAGGADVAKITPAILNNYFSFREKSEDSNRSRWPVAKWWRSFLGTAEKLSVARRVQKGNMEKRAKWFAKQAAPSLAMLTESLGIEAMQDVFAAAHRNLSTVQKREVEKYKNDRAARRLRNYGDGEKAAS